MKLCVFLCWLKILRPSLSCFGDDFDVSQKTFEDRGVHSTFTFRRGALIHEITVLIDPATTQRNNWVEPNNWVEQFYADNRPVFFRAGAAHLSSAHYTGPSRVSLVGGGRRLYVGREAFNMGDDGFYHVIADPRSVLQESVINDPVFSTHALDEERRKHLAATDFMRLIPNDDATITPLIYFDEKTRISYYVESDGRHVSAIASDGKVLWHRDPFVEGKLEPYRYTRPVIEFIGPESFRGSKTVLEIDGTIGSGPGPIQYHEDKISISFNSSQFGTLDKKTGDFTSRGQD